MLVLFRIAALGLALCCAGAESALAQTVRIDYGIDLVGLPIGEATLLARVEGQHYQLELSGRTRGALHLFSDVKLAATATGILDDKGPAPDSYRHLFTSGGKADQSDLRFANGRVDAFSATPARRHPERYIPVTPEQLENVLDPLSAVLRRPAQVAADKCAASLPLFDGRERFDLELHYKRLDTLALPGFPPRDIIVCDVQYRAVSGHRPGKTNPIEEANGADEIWLADLPDADLLVPVKLRMRTELGTLTIAMKRWRES